MWFLKPRQLKEAFCRMKEQSKSMRGRFVGYILLQICAIGALALLLLNLFGGLNLASARLEQALDYQLASSAMILENDIDTLAANAVVFSNQLTTELEKYLSDAGLSFDDLRNDPEALAVLQSDMYLAVYNNMRITPCSGAFYFLDTTANDALERDYYSGIYLKFANLFSDNTVHNRACLYRGFSAVARENGINLHSTWQNEMLAGVFAELDAMMDSNVERLSSSYLLTSVYQLPDTWERARFLCVPLLDAQGDTIGVCGFEISDLYFKLSHKTMNTEQDYIICVLLDQTENGYIGQISGSQSGYTPCMEDIFTLKEGKHFTTIQCENMSFYGKVREITVAETTHLLIVMIPKVQYDNYIQEEQSKTAMILLIIVVATACSCLWISKQYVSPILKGLEQLKTDPNERLDTRVQEINDLFDFLAQKDSEHEASIIEQQRKVEDLQGKIESLQGEQAKAQMELSRLAYLRKQEIDPDHYRLFLDNLHTLTATEKQVFEYYLSGKSTKEIMELMSIKETTLKYHNRNIYNKLGVTSRKELLRYAALMNQQKKEEMERNDTC